MSAFLRADDGTCIPLDTARWRREVDHTEIALLSTLPTPLIDIGCGPGRVAAAIAATGQVVLAIDSSPAAVAEAAERGVAVLCRSVFDPVPGEGRWRAAILLDGNIGIGGDPISLLHRVRELLAPGGHIVAEVEPPSAHTSIMRVRLQAHEAAAPGPWFPWARVGADDFASMATAAGLLPCGLDHRKGRWFARALRP